MTSHAFETVNEDGRKCYWYYPRQSPRRRERREQNALATLLGLLFPMPPEPPNYRLCDDEVERERLRAIDRLRYELQFKVYEACDPARGVNYAGDDPLDPVIDYEVLKAKLTCVFNLKYGGPHGEYLDYPWEAGAPFNWAPQDVVHANVAAQDPVMQRFLAAGGDPQLQPYAGYIDVSDSE